MLINPNERSWFRMASHVAKKKGPIQPRPQDKEPREREAE